MAEQNATLQLWTFRVGVIFPAVIVANAFIFGVPIFLLKGLFANSLSSSPWTVLIIGHALYFGTIYLLVTNPKLKAFFEWMEARHKELDRARWRL